MAVGPSPDRNPRSWDHSVYEYLAQNTIKCSSATSMQGGHSSYIWRLENVNVSTGKDPKSTIDIDKCVLKFAEDTAKLKDIPFPPDRLQWEYRALQSNAVQEACALEPSVRVPRVLSATGQGLVLEWMGEVDLRTAILTGAIQDESAISSKLGKWLAHMHKAGLRDGSTQTWKNNGMAEKVLGLEESGVRSLLAAHQTPLHIIERALTTFRLPAGGLETGVIVDFRPMNVLLSKLEAPEPTMAVIDMECSTYGDLALDFHIWLAEALIIEAQTQRKDLVGPFLSAYAHEAGPEIVTRAFACKVAVLLGAMWSFTSFSVWNAQGDAEHWRQSALKYILAGAEQDVQWLAQSDLRPLLRYDAEFLHLFQ